MKAVQINQYGSNNVLEINKDTPNPSSKKDQILVVVYAASINPFDLAIRAGFVQKMAPLQFPATVGEDFAGIITQVGDNVSNFKVGDEVYGQANVLGGGSGSFAEILAANANNTAFKPKSTNFAEAAALPLVGSSAIQALIDYINLKSGQKILIHGGAGGIGHIAIQLAKTLGAHVATTVSIDDMDFVRQLGADRIIDYKNQKFEEVLKDFDAVFDTVGGETTNKSFAVLKKGGVLVSMLGLPDQELAQKHGVTAIGQNTQTNTEHLNRLTEFVDSGKIKVRVDRVFALEQVKEAYRYQESHPRGKVVLKIKDV